MPDEPVLFDVDDDGIARITLNRPEKLNAFGAGMVKRLGSFYRRCDEDDRIRAVVLTGAGRAFCSGADMSDPAATFARKGHSFEGFSAAATDFPAFRIRKLVVAAVNGHAIGVGLSLALQCDLRLFAEEGRYGIVQVRRGVLGDAYSHWTLPRLVGLTRAAEIMLTGRLFAGSELERLGIANRVLPATEVLPAALEIARETAIQAAPLSVACSKRLLWESFELSPEQIERRETALHVHLMPAPDAIEGPVAHAEKRDPSWSLRVSRDWPRWPEDPPIPDGEPLESPEGE